MLKVTVTMAHRYCKLILPIVVATDWLNFTVKLSAFN